MRATREKGIVEGEAGEGEEEGIGGGACEGEEGAAAAMRAKGRWGSARAWPKGKVSRTISRRRSRGVGERESRARDE